MGGRDLPDGIRTAEQIREHYEVEKDLAKRLRLSTKEDRRLLYTSIYEELFRRIPHHPQLLLRADPHAAAVAVARRMRLLRRFLNRDSTFMEVGAGDCRLALEVAKHARKVYAIDVSRKITEQLSAPANFELVISDGISVPLPQASIGFAYSDQLMEHLHPSDAVEQLHGIWEALAPGGIYLCVTPNGLAGPHDVSRFFDESPTGLHLKEYTFHELEDLFLRAGFRQIRAYAGGKGLYVRSPLFLIRLCEMLLGVLPFRVRRAVARVLPIRALLGVIIVGRK